MSQRVPIEGDVVQVRIALDFGLEVGVHCEMSSTPDEGEGSREARACQ
jgi:hypothetical protein